MITLTSNINTAFNTVKGLTWIVKLTLDDATRYWASEIVTISSQEYVGRFVLEDGLAEIDQSVDISIGGGLASVGNTSLDLKEIVTQNGLHRDFKPQSAGTELLNRTAEIGCIYNFGSLSTSDIVWLYKGVIDDFNLSIEGIGLDVVGAREVETLDLPRELINATDYVNAPTENIGLPIPILYGDFYTVFVSMFNFGVDLDPTLYAVAAPAVLVDNSTNKYYCASHVSHTVFDYMMFHDGSMNQFAAVETLTGSGTTSNGTMDLDNAGYTSGVLDPGQVLIYYITLFSRPGGANNATNPDNLLDRDGSNTVVLDNAGASDILALQLDNVPAGLISSIAVNWNRSAGTESFRVGYTSDSYVFTAGSPGTYVGTTATSGGDTLSGFTTTDASNLSKYQFVVNASGAGETITLTRFYARIDIWLSLKKESKTVGRLTNPIEPGVQRPRGSGGR